MTDMIIVLTTAGADEAETLARTLVDERLAACVNVHAPMTSIYWWKGRVARDTERQLTIKTTRSRLEALQSRLTEIHSYELPELLVLPIDWGSDAYVDWVNEETRPG